MPHFGPRGQILFRLAEGNANYLEQMNQDGSGRSKVVPYPIIEIQSISPGRKWLMALAPYPEGNSAEPQVDGDSARRRTSAAHVRKLLRSRHGRRAESSFSFRWNARRRPSPGRSLAIPVGPGEILPELPPGGLEPGAEPSVVPGSQSVNREELVPGEDLAHYAYVNTTAHRNLYRISLP